MQPFGFSKGEGLCVAICADEHMEAVHGETGVDFQLPHGYRYDIWDVVDGHARAYREMGRPEWAAKVQDYVRVNQERILRAYGEGTVPWATPEDTKQARAYLNSL